MSRVRRHIRFKATHNKRKRTHIQNCPTLTCPADGFLGELGPEFERVDVASESSLEEPDDSCSCVGEWEFFGMGGIV